MKCIITFQFPLKHHISISQLIQWLRVFGSWLKSARYFLLIVLEIISYMNIDLNIALYKPSEGTNQYITLSDDIISHHHTCLLITDKSNNCWLQCLRRKWAVFINCVQGHFSVDSILVLTLSDSEKKVSVCVSLAIILDNICGVAGWPPGR